MNAASNPSSAPGSAIVTAAYHWNFAEYMEVMDFRVRRMETSLFSRISRVLLVLVALFLVLTPSGGVLDFEILFYSAVVLAIFLVRGRVILLFAHWRWQKGILPPCDLTYHFIAAGLVTRVRGGQNTLPWKGFFAIHEAARGFVFYLSPRLHHRVPFHAFEGAADIEQVRRFIRESGARYRKLPF